MHAQKKRGPTLRDLAQKTGYSINTVSRALRDKEDIAPATRESIREIAESMGYRNNTIAASLRLGYTSTIAVIVGDIANPHFAVMTKEIETRARELGYISLLMNTSEDPVSEREAIITAINHNVDGIIICPTQQSEENSLLLLESGIPFVQIGRSGDHDSVSSVVCDDEHGGYLATEHLIKKGHRDILMLNGPEYISSSRKRRAGYLRALADNGLKPDPALSKTVPVTPGGCAEILDRLLKTGPHFTALFAFSDILAWEAWVHLNRLGYKIPEDISIVGFDHIQSLMTIPVQLTTIGCHAARMSVTAVECLYTKMRGHNSEKIPSAALHHRDTPCRHIVETELVLGESVKDISGGEYYSVTKASLRR